MSRVQLITGFLIAFLAQVAAHGHLSVPTSRDYNLRQDQQNAPVSFPLSSDFVCRNYTATPSNLWTTLVAGSSTPMKWAMEAAHPGDCFAYLSYDGESVPDVQKKWFKIAEFGQCNLQNMQTMTLNIPSYLPSCEHCILRWEWYALHLQSIGIVEFYSQCADVKIVGNPNGQLPSPQVVIPGHLPQDASQYRPGFGSDDFHMTGPAIATVGGSSYSCDSTYGSSCVAPSPSKNPCTISTQRCVTSTTYQACGIGATTTVWGPEQSCQTGLVCANHPDGQHIMCTYPSSVSTPTPTPVSVPTPSPVQVPVPVPVQASTTGRTQVAPTPTPVPVSVPTPVPVTPSVPATIPTLPPVSDVCTLRDMRCVGESSYSTCTNSNTGTYWAAVQTCRSGEYCVPNGNTVYCGVSKPSTVSPTPAPVSTTPTVPAPVPSPVPVPAPVPTQVPSPVSSSCVLGDQRCTSVGSSTYQTCYTLRDGSTAWAPSQSCQTGLSCHPSNTANNIYCY